MQRKKPQQQQILKQNKPKKQPSIKKLWLFGVTLHCMIHAIIV